MVPRHLPPVGGSYGVINERRLNGGTSEGDPRKEGRGREGRGGALTLKVRRKKEEKGPILHTLHYIWDRGGDESSVRSGTMSLAQMQIISLFSQPLSSFTILGLLPPAAISKREKSNCSPPAPRRFCPQFFTE